MQFKHFVGIDISKLSLDASFYGKPLYQKFSNDHNGFQALLSWASKNVGSDPVATIVFYFEHTGFYSLLLAVFMEENGCNFSIISPLQIKRSLGIARGKNDKIDSRRIAAYGYEKRDGYVAVKLPSKAILKLQSLMTLRDRLARQRGAFVGTLKEQSSFLPADQLSVLAETYTNLIKALTQEISRIEKAVKTIIQQDAELSKTFGLITGIKGVGLLVAAYLIVYTHNFTRFDNWRKCACYAGIAPFETTSGTSLRGKNKVHPVANKQIKKMLHMAAVSAAHTDKEMMAFYIQRTKGGKSKMNVINIIRNKILARVFAVVKRGTPYVDMLKYAA